MSATRYYQLLNQIIDMPDPVRPARRGHLGADRVQGRPLPRSLRRGGAPPGRSRRDAPRPCRGPGRRGEGLHPARGPTGAEVEDKGHSVALHYRNATSPASGEAIAAWAQERAEALGLQVRPGKMVVELSPPGPTKADALERLVAGSG